MTKADEIRKLLELRDSGALTEEEFQREKATLLASDARNQHGPPPVPVPPGGNDTNRRWIVAAVVLVAVALIGTIIGVVASSSSPPKPASSSTSTSTSPPTSTSTGGPASLSESTLQSLGAPAIAQMLNVPCETYTAAPSARMLVGSTDYTTGFQLKAACGGGTSRFTWNLDDRFRTFTAKFAMDSTNSSGCVPEMMQILGNGSPVDFQLNGLTVTQADLTESVTPVTVDVFGDSSLGIELALNTCAGPPPYVLVDVINDHLS